MWVCTTPLVGSVQELFAVKKNRTADCVKVLLDVAKESSDWFPPLKAALGGVNTLIKHYEVLVEWLAIAHISHGRSQHFEDVKEKIEDRIPQLDRLKQNIATTTVNVDPEETKRRNGLPRYVHQFMTAPTASNPL